MHICLTQINIENTALTDTNSTNNLILLSSLLDEAESLLVKNSDTYIYVKSLDPPVTDLGHPVYPVSGSLGLPIVSLTRRCTHWSLH